MSEPSITSETPRSPRRWHDLGTRAASGVVLVALAVGTAKIGGLVFIVAWLAGAIAVLWEWQRMVGGAAVAARTLAGGLTLVVVAALAQSYLPQACVLLFGAAALSGFLAGPEHRSWSAGGMLYAGVLLLAVIGLRFSFPFGSRAIIWLFATVWATDTFAYFGGRLIGGPKLSPRISPKKTWSGTLTGLLAGSLIGAFAAVRDLPEPRIILPIFFVTLAASFFSQAGDAFESAIKRRFGVKDSSGLIPGHGGVMDRLDGFIAAAAFAFALGLSRNFPSIAEGLLHWA